MMAQGLGFFTARHVALPAGVWGSGLWVACPSRFSAERPATRERASSPKAVHGKLHLLSLPQKPMHDDACRCGICGLRFCVVCRPPGLQTTARWARQ